MIEYIKRDDVLTKIVIPMPNYNTTISNEEKLYNDKVGEQNE